MVKHPPANAGDAADAGSISGSGRSPGEGNGNPLQYSSGKSHGRKSLVGYSPWGHKKSDKTEGLHFHFQSGRTLPKINKAEANYRSQRGTC